MSGYSCYEGIADWKGEEFDMIKNERIRIYPASQEQMEKCIDSDPDNAASQRVLEKCGFLATGEIGEEGPRFIVYKENNKQ